MDFDGEGIGVDSIVVGAPISRWFRFASAVWKAAGSSRRCHDFVLS